MSGWPEGMAPLLFYIDDDVTDSDRQAGASAVRTLVESRDWAFEPPVSVDGKTTRAH